VVQYGFAFTMVHHPPRSIEDPLVDTPQASRDGLLEIISIGLASAVALMTPIGPAEVRLGLALLAAGAAGTLASWLLLPVLDPSEGWDSVDVAALASCLTVAIVVLVCGLITALPGPISVQSLVLGTLMTMMALVVAAFKRRVRGRPIALDTIWRVILLLLVAGSLRLIDLGYSEYQGDEASILHRAAAIVQDVNEALLAHRKGPGEILVATYFGQLVGRVTEADARFPFAIASVMSVLAIYAVGRAMFGPTAGLVAALLWAINGYSVGFGRIVQYHSVTVLLSTVALLCAWKTVRTSPHAWKLRFVTIGLLGMCLVFAFNVITLGLPAVVLILMSVTRDWRRVGRTLMPRTLGRMESVIVVIGIAAVSLVALYVALEWRDMQRILSWRLGQGQPFNNLDMFASVSVRYLGLPYLLLLMGSSLGVGIWLASRIGGSRRRGRLIGLTLAALIALLIALHGQPTGFAVTVWALLAIACIAAAGTERHWRVLGIAALVPIGLYGFMLAQTGTHWYEAFPAMCLLAGGLASRIAWRLRNRLGWAIAPAGAALTVVLGVYPFFAFLPIWTAEGMPAESFYRPPWRAIRDGGSFGFPHQDGLKAVSLLADVGALPPPYNSNATAEVTTWYMPTTERCERTPTSYLIAFSERRPSVPLPPQDGWVITVRGQPRGLIRVQNDSPPDFAQVAVEAPAGWFDSNLARLERPLSVPRALCNRTMRPFWRPN
jgi:hypothetical protein